MLRSGDIWPSFTFTGSWNHVCGSRGFHLCRRVTLADALSFSEQQRWQQAADAWQQLLSEEMLPAELKAQAQCACGDALLKLGQDESALRQFQSASNSGTPMAWLRVANAWRRLGQFGQAERAYRQLLKRPRVGDTFNAVAGAAVMMLRQGKLSKMKRLLETWTSRSPEDPRSAQNLLLLLGFLEERFTCFRTLALFPLPAQEVIEKRISAFLMQTWGPPFFPLHGGRP